MGFDLIFDFIHYLMFLLFFWWRSFFFGRFLYFWWRLFDGLGRFCAFVDKGHFFDVSIFESFDKLLKFFDLETGFVFTVVDDSFGGVG
jgi:hypothetical protein